jgi:4-hydroxybenzoyl-CoA thioesterase
MSGPFTMRQRLRFQDCDPAGIAYYPRYLALCDAVIEEWTESVLGISRGRLHFERKLGLPTVHLEADFVAVSRLGDWLDFKLCVAGLGRSSVSLIMSVASEGSSRFDIRYKQVLIDMTTMKSKAWPAEWRARLEDVLESAP